MRVTKKQLENKVNYLNDLTFTQNLKLRQNEINVLANTIIGKGNKIYPFVSINEPQVVNKGGGAKTLLNTGYTTKKELYNNINSFLLGIELGKNVNQ